MSGPVSIVACLAEDRPMVYCVRLALPRVFGLMSLPVFVGARVALPEL